MSCALYTVSASPFGWAVQLAAAVKGVELELHWLQPSPEGPKRPMLRDGEQCYYESPTIIAYLDAKHPEPPLYGASPEQRSRVEQLSSETGRHLSAALPAFVGNIFSGRAKQEQAAIAAAGEAIVAELQRHEAALASRAHVAMEILSAADLQLYPLIRVFLRAASHPSAAEFHLRDDFSARFPALTAWMSRIEALPNFASTLPPGW